MSFYSTNSKYNWFIIVMKSPAVFSTVFDNSGGYDVLIYSDAVGGKRKVKGIKKGGEGSKLLKNKRRDISGC